MATMLLSAQEAHARTLVNINKETLELEAYIAGDIANAIKKEKFSCYIGSIHKFSEVTRRAVIDKLKQLGYTVVTSNDQRDGFSCEISWSKK